MKFSELQRLQRREGVTVLSSDARIEQLEARLCTITKERDALRAELSKQQTLTVAAQHIAEVAQSRANQLRARIKEREKQEPVAWCATDETGTVIEALGMNQSRRFDTALYHAPGAQPAPGVRPAALYPVISWLRNGCDPMKAADELEILIAATEAKP